MSKFLLVLVALFTLPALAQVEVIATGRTAQALKSALEKKLGHDSAGFEAAEDGSWSSWRGDIESTELNCQDLSYEKATCAIVVYGDEKLELLRGKLAEALMKKVMSLPNSSFLGRDAQFTQVSISKLSCKSEKPASGGRRQHSCSIEI